jgi:hypothetical protein
MFAGVMFIFLLSLVGVTSQPFIGLEIEFYLAKDGGDISNLPPLWIYDQKIMVINKGKVVLYLMGENDNKLELKTDPFDIALLPDVLELVMETIRVWSNKGIFITPVGQPYFGITFKKEEGFVDALLETKPIHSITDGSVVAAFNVMTLNRIVSVQTNIDMPLSIYDNYDQFIVQCPKLFFHTIDTTNQAVITFNIDHPESPPNMNGNDLRVYRLKKKLILEYLSAGEQSKNNKDIHFDLPRVDFNQQSINRKPNQCYALKNVYDGLIGNVGTMSSNPISCFFKKNTQDIWFVMEVRPEKGINQILMAGFTSVIPKQEGDEESETDEITSQLENLVVKLQDSILQIKIVWGQQNIVLLQNNK